MTPNAVKSFPSIVQILGGPPLYWICQVIGWGGILMISFTHYYIDQVATPALLLDSSFFFLFLGFSSHLYRVVIQVFGWCELDLRHLLPRALAGAAVFALAHTGLVEWLVPLAPPPGVNQETLTPNERFLVIVVSDFFTIMAWSCLYFGYHFQRSYEGIQFKQLRLQAALREAEHRALSAQINPHFLFNSLNTLCSLIDENPPKARQTVADLAALFRASLKTSRKNLITLREEMATVRSYLALEQSRFEHRLVISESVPDEALHALLPPFLLQTLIENAIKHGLGPHPQAEISYRVALEPQGLTLQVTNPGCIRSARGATTGVGLENSRLRLQLLFGAKAFLHLTSPEENLVRAEALIPQRIVA